MLAANGDKLFVFGKTDLTLTIDDMVIHNDALVAQINADGILGLDFILANSCSSDVCHEVLLLKDKKNTTADRVLHWLQSNNNK